MSWTLGAACWDRLEDSRPPTVVAVAGTDGRGILYPARLPTFTRLAPSADVAHLVALSRATMANIHQNVVFAIGLKGLFLVTTVLGITGLWIAVLADTGATALVTLNALRLARTGALLPNERTIEAIPAEVRA